MAAQQLQHSARSATAEQNLNPQYNSFDDSRQLTLPEIAEAPTAKKAMQYECLDNPVEPTGRQNKFVLSKLKKCAAGLTTVELTAMGVADPRPRIRDLRELGWCIDTIQLEPHDVGRYVLTTAESYL